jgi:DNA polymerase elongation subunit (family B)
MLWLDWINGSRNRVTIGEWVINEKDDEQYSSNTKDAPVAEIKKLRPDGWGRYKYGTDYPVYKKKRGIVDIEDYSKYKRVYFDLENLNGVRDSDIDKRRITAYSFFYDGEHQNYGATHIPEDEEIYIIRKIIKSINHRDRLVIGWNFEYDYNLLKKRYEYLTRKRFPDLECVMIDMMSVYSKFVLNKPNKIGVKLETALTDNGVEGKIKYDGDLDSLYYNDLDKYLQYSERDTKALYELDQKLGLTNLILEICHISGCIIHDVMHNSLIIESLCYKFLKEHGLMFRNRQKNDKTGFTGAKVIDPQPGYHKGVRCVDLNSLYPFIIMNWNISPETFSNRKENKNYKETPAGTFFDQSTKGFFAYLVEMLIDKRNEYRDAENQSTQKSYKFLGNSVYGVMGTPFFRLSNVDVARTITACGRDLLLHLKKYINYIYGDGEDIIIYGDTDSMFIKHGEDLADVINNELIPLYYQDIGLEPGDRPFGVKDEYGVVDMIVFNIKKTYLVRMENGETVYKNIDKSNRIPAAMEFFKFVGDCIFDGDIQTKEELEEVKQGFLDMFTLEKDNLMPYSVKKKRIEYKTSQPWMGGLDNFYSIYPDYNGMDNNGVIIEYKGSHKISPKTGRKLKGRETVRLCVPDGMDIQEVHNRFIQSRPDIEVNQEYYDNILLSLIHHYDVCFGSE